jgi:hypothetical protein
MKVEYTNLPKKLSRDDYEKAAVLAVADISTRPGVRAVYLFGTQWQPGVSDLDLLVVMENGAPLVSFKSPWSLSSSASFIFTHRYLTLEQGVAEKLFYLYPKETTRLRLLWGQGIWFEDPQSALPLEEYTELIACVFFDLLVNKLLPLAGSIPLVRSVNVRQRIGEMYSLTYSERLLSLICGYAMPGDFKEGLIQLRAAWLERSEEENILQLERMSKQAIDTVADMTEGFARYTRTRYTQKSVVKKFSNRRYRVVFVDSWTRKNFVGMYERGFVRESFFKRRLVHDTLLIPKELSVYFAWYASAGGPFSMRVRKSLRGIPQEVSSTGIAAHLSALDRAFADYEASDGLHKIPYAFGFSPRRMGWRDRLIGVVGSSLSILRRMKRVVAPEASEPVKMPVIIPLSRFSTFDEYLAALSANKRSEYRRAMRDYSISWEIVPFDRDLVERFMDLWSQQLVYGKRIRWKFNVDKVDEWAKEGNLLVFKGGEVALQFARKKIEGGLDLNPVMYEKTGNSRLPKYMTFKLIQYIIENKLGDLDLGFISSSEEGTQYKLNYMPKQ